MSSTPSPSLVRSFRVHGRVARVVTRFVVSDPGPALALESGRRRSYRSDVERLSRRDLRGALDFVHAASSTAGDGPFPRPAVESLARLVPGETVAYSEWDLEARGSPSLAVESPTTSTPPDVAEARSTLCESYPLSIRRLSSATQPCRLSDFISSRALHRLEYYDHVLRPLGVEYQVRLWLPASPGRSHVFCFDRARTGGDFNDRDRTLLALLRPFLVAMRERFALREARNAIEADGVTA